MTFSIRRWPRTLGNTPCAWLIAHFLLTIEHLEDAIRAHGHRLQDSIHPGENPYLSLQTAQVREEDNQRAYGQFTLQDVVRAVPENRRSAQSDDQAGR